ncbi:MAG: zinc ribbon domain-containing protein [Planctomycetales bacterium]|nr:zinc ribbon domain-containing protein [Planctomycetales bacterium]
MSKTDRSANQAESIIEATIVAEEHSHTGVLQAEIVVDDEPAPSGAPCPSCGSPNLNAARFCAACGAPLDPPSPAVSARPVEVPSESPELRENSSAVLEHAFQCNNCGSQVATNTDQRSYVCPFCDSAYVTEISPSRSSRQRPEFVIGFAVSAQRAQQLYFEWLGKNAWFRPGDLAAKAISEKQRGVYMPFWHFSMKASSRWSASIGEYWYRTETYTEKDASGKTVTKTRQVRETEWFPLSGNFQRYYHGYLVSATTSLPPEQARAIQPFSLTELARYRPFYLAGWMAEEYTIGLQQAQLETEQEFSRRQHGEVSRFLPGDTHSNLQVDTKFQLGGSDLILLPVHVLSYRYRDRVFRFLVNGQTGRVVGEKPLSAKRISALVVAILLVIAIAVIAIILLGNR